MPGGILSLRGGVRREMRRCFLKLESLDGKYKKVEEPRRRRRAPKEPMSRATVAVAELERAPSGACAPAKRSLKTPADALLMRLRSSPSTGLAFEILVLRAEGLAGEIVLLDQRSKTSRMMRNRLTCSAMNGWKHGCSARLAKNVRRIAT